MDIQPEHLDQLATRLRELLAILDAGGRLGLVAGPKKRWKVTARPPKGRDGKYWQLRLYPPGGGRSRQESARPATTEEDAWARARAREQELNGDSLPLAEIQARHLEHLEATGAKPNTVSSYRTALARVGRQLGTRPLSRSTLLELRDELEAEGLAAKTINGYLRFASLAWKWGRERELCLEEWPKIPPLREAPTELRPCTPDELAALLAYFDGRARKWAWEGPFFGLVAAAGSRVGETLALRQEDLDRERGLVRFRASESKTDQHRWSAVPPSTLARLPDSPGLLWPQLRRWHIQRAWERALQATGLEAEPIRPHSLRRSWITDAFEAGAPLTHIMTQVGHVNAETTIAYQARASRRDLARSARRVETYRAEATSPTPPPPSRGGQPVDSQHTQRTQRTQEAQGTDTRRCSGTFRANPQHMPILGRLRAVLDEDSPTAALVELLGDPEALHALVRALEQLE